MQRRFRALAVLILATMAVAQPALARPDSPTPEDLWKYGASDKVETLDSQGGNFKIHFVRSGVNAVPSADADGDGTPDHVQNLAALYEQVLTFYVGLGFKKPLDDKDVPGNNGGDGRFDVYLLDFGKQADGHFQREACTGDTCEGFMEVENDFVGYGYPSLDYANRVLASHEFFHAVQAAYDANQNNVISEGTAVWATEKFDASLGDFEGFIDGYLSRPDHSLDKPMVGPVDAFSYGAAIFFEFLDERLGPQVIVQLWRDCENGQQGVADPQWFQALSALLSREHQSSFATEFAAFAWWNVLTGKYADPKRSYASGKAYPYVAATKLGLADLPYQDTELRVFYSSNQYLRALPGARDIITAGVAVAASIDPSTLQLRLLTRTGNTLSDPISLPLVATGSWLGVDTTAADEVFAILTNTAQTGESIRGTLCLGSPDEVAACMPPPADAGANSDAAAGDDATADAKGPAADGISASETANSAGASSSKAGSSSGCTAGPRAAIPGAGWLLVALGAVLVVRKRRQFTR